VLGKRDENGTQRTFLVRATKGDWVRVFLPTRPNGSQGWVKRRAVRVYTNGYRLVIRLRSNELRLWRGDRMLAKYPVAVGTRSTPTPRGLYYIVELLQPGNPNGSYGPFSFGLSAHSNVLKRFAGGDGRVGLHGTNQPGAGRLRCQSRLHPAAERCGAAPRENPAARYAGLYPLVTQRRVVR